MKFYRLKKESLNLGPIKFSKMSNSTLQLNQQFEDTLFPMHRIRPVF